MTTIDAGDACVVVVPASRCELGKRFRRCKNTSNHVCQYCGYSFCDDHAYYLEGYDAVCTRKRCTAKHDDLQRHLEYKDNVRASNGTGHCGEPGCEVLHPALQCSFCQGSFCLEHVKERMYSVQEGYVKVDKPVGLCDWCWGRRKIWQRR